MSKQDFSRRTRGYYKFSKKYPSRRGAVYAIGESRKVRKKERAKRIVFAALLCCLFVLTYIAASFVYKLSTRPIPDNSAGDTPLITADNIGTVRAVYIENETLAEIGDLSAALTEAKKNGFNAIMLDFKAKDGYLAYDSAVGKYSGTGGLNLIDGVIVDKIKSEGLSLIARVCCFEDGISPQRLNAFVFEDEERTRIWFDAPAVEGGKAWLNPASAAATDYLCTVIAEVKKLGADCIYLESVQFPASRAGTAQYFTEDDSSLNRNLVLQSFIENAVKAAGSSPVILGTSLQGAAEGDAEKWGGNLFDTAAPVCSPELSVPENGDYIAYINEKTAELNESVKNNFGTIKIIPTVKNQRGDASFYEKIALNGTESYIIIP